MFNSPILDLVILLSFTYFIGSLLLSTINEWIVNGLWELRRKNLKEAIEKLVMSDGWKTFVQDTLIKNPHIEALMKKKGEYPSNIPSSNFISAIVEQIGTANYTAAGINQGISNSPLPIEFKKIL